MTTINFSLSFSPAWLAGGRLTKRTLYKLLFFFSNNLHATSLICPIALWFCLSSEKWHSFLEVIFLWMLVLPFSQQCVPLLDPQSYKQHLVKPATCFPVMNANDFKTEFEMLVEYILYFKTKFVVEVATLYQEQSRPRLFKPLAHAILARSMFSWASLSIPTSY